jgi:ATP adenylyltransferase
MPEGKSEAQETLRLEPGTLWAKAIARTEHARQCGALQFVPTECEFVEQGGVNFLVRVLPQLGRKDDAKKEQDKDFNPFLPYEEDLFVADISDTHLCLLNKFNVVDHHLLIVTRAFEEQETLLTLQDFEAMWACLAEIDGLAFYNGGKLAGASQRHKHLQLVPLPLIPEGARIPIEPVIAGTQFEEGVGTAPGFPFAHAIAKFDSQCVESPRGAASYTLERYRIMLQHLGLMTEESNQQKGAYNLIATREWMLIVPRSQDEFESIPVNSLGFAGALLVRSEQQMQLLRDCSPMTVLKNVAVPAK